MDTTASLHFKLHNGTKRNRIVSSKGIVVLRLVVSILTFCLFSVITLSAKPTKSSKSKAATSVSPTTQSLSASDSVRIMRDSIQKSQALLSSLIKLQKSNPSSLDALNKNDSNSLAIKAMVKSIVNVEQIKSKNNFLSHKEIMEQSKSFIKIYAECENANNFLKQSFNYTLALNQLTLFNDWKEKAINGVIKNRDQLLTVRNLTTTSILLDEILQKTLSSLYIVNEHHSKLSHAQFRLDSLVDNSNIYEAPSDSVALKSYVQKMIFMKSNLDPVNKSLNASIDSIQKIQIQFEILKLGLQSDILSTQNLRKNLFEGNDSTTIFNLASSKVNTNSFRSDLSYSKDKALLVLAFYSINHAAKFSLMFLIIVLVFIYLRLLAKRCQTVNILTKLNQYTVVLKYPLSSSVLLSLSLFQFFLPDPPIIISAILWTISALILSYILWHTINRYWFYVWNIFTFLFIMTLFGNLVLRYSETERLLVYFVSFAVLGVSTHILFQLRKIELISKPLVIPFILMVGMQFIAIYYNFVGNYNSAKILLSDGLFLFMLTFILLWCLRLASEMLKISKFFQQSLNDENHQLPSTIFSNKYPVSAYLLLVVASLYLIIRLSYFYQSIVGPLISSFSETRTIGKFSFTYESVFIFFLVMYISTILSKIVSFLSAGATLQTKNSKSNGPGSWLLLIKIAIIGSGVVLAFVAAGIPMDRLAIIISALGVGIAFGLQTLINNLVSGMIIALEKPINVGDFVEIAGRSGKMKSIGIRSSIVTTWDGADVVIPNGDLMNQHLTNWTMGNNRKRFEIPVGVAYGTDLAFTQHLLMQLMLSDDRIMKNPEPIVLLTQFNNSSIDFVVKFWVHHYDMGLDMKSDLIIAINNAFKENNIEIPFPQNDIHIKTTSEESVVDSQIVDNQKVVGDK